jgi:outer membrane lipoprotein
MKRFAMLLLTVLLTSSCAHVVSQNVREQALRSEEVPALFQNPNGFRGATAILGGTIIGSRNTEKGTYLEVLQAPLDSRGRPRASASTHGRFMAFHPSYLETAIYSRGRAITVAGEVVGSILQPIGEMDYLYPLINVRELHLFEVRRAMPLRFSIGVGAVF